MKLSPATLANAAAMAQVHAQAFDTPWPAPEIAGLVDGLGAFGFLAEADAPLGMALCRVAGGEAEILTLAVAPRARRRGIATALVLACVDAARGAGAEAVFLEAAVDNGPALALYRRLGFAAAGLRPGYYDRGPLGRADAQVLRLDLNDGARSAYGSV
jgi:ribosomal-protein-alanine N-acetyltransferase